MELPHPPRPRKIIHVDMDAFFASVEQRDDPALRGKPVVVGGSPQSRGVVASASYEARAFGVRSAMSCANALRLCPNALFVRPRFEAYRSASQAIMEIFRDYTDLVEPLSLDEAFLDVTENKVANPSATLIAIEIRARIERDLRLTASAGIAPNKFLAKIASDMNKPNGMTVIPPERVALVLEDLPVRKIPGVGPVTEARMKALGIETTKDLRLFSEEHLREVFGKSGAYYGRLARGEDNRPVEPSRERKSVGVEETFSTDITEREKLLEELRTLAEKGWTRLRNRLPHTVTVKVTYHNFEKVTRARTLDHTLSSSTELYEIAQALLWTTEAGHRPIRLLGISTSHFAEIASPAPSKAEHSIYRRTIQLSLPFTPIPPSVPSRAPQ